MPAVEACVVTYNSAATIERLLDSLLSEPSVVLVRILDNGSDDQTAGILRTRAAKEPRITVAVSDSNIGFPAGCNVLIRQCTAEAVLLVNPDVELRAGVLPCLLEALRSDSGIGAATCQLRTRDGQPQSEPARAAPTLRRLMAGSAPSVLRRLRHRQARAEVLDEVKDVEATMGALMLLPRTVFTELGLLDESVFMYLEDLDFSARLRRAGYRIRYQGNVWAWHDSGVSSKSHGEALYVLLPQVWLTYFHRYGSTSQRRLVRALLVCLCVSRLASRAVRRTEIATHLAALRHALTYRPRTRASW